LLVELLASAPPGRDRAFVLTRLGWVRAHAQGLHAAEEAFRAALAEHPAEDALRVDIEQGLSWSVHSMTSAHEAVAHARTAYRLAERIGDASLMAGALSYLALLESLAGEGISLAAAARASELGHTPVWSQILGRTDWVHALLIGWSGHLLEARELFTSLLARAEAHGDEHALPAIMFQLARLEVLLGDWPSAERHARECVDATVRSGMAGERPYALTISATVDAHLGRADHAFAALAEARRLADELGVQPAGLEAQVVQGFLELSLGDHAAAAQTYATLMAHAARAGFREPAVLRHRGDAVETFLALGRRADAEAVAGELDELAGRLGRPSVMRIALRCRGLLAAASGDLDQAQDALRAALALDVEGEPFERARTRLALGAVLRRDKQKRAARDELAAATGEFAALGAALWVARAQSELARVGGTPGREDALTATERRVADLIAAGRSYREAADELFISPKTVQWNLSKVYRKLGIRSRAELPARLATEPEPD
jgi:DNA-binding CsgD family transcriptional regulator